MPATRCPVTIVRETLSKWNTGIGWYETGRILTADEIENAWQRILDELGTDKARWHIYSPELPGFG